MIFHRRPKLRSTISQLAAFSRPFQVGNSRRLRNTLTCYSRIKGMSARILTVCALDVTLQVTIRLKVTSDIERLVRSWVLHSGRIRSRFVHSTRPYGALAVCGSTTGRPRHAAAAVIMIPSRHFFPRVSSGLLKPRSHYPVVRTIRTCGPVGA